MLQWIIIKALIYSYKIKGKYNLKKGGVLRTDYTLLKFVYCLFVYLLLGFRTISGQTQK